MTQSYMDVNQAPGALRREQIAERVVMREPVRQEEVVAIEEVVAVVEAASSSQGVNTSGFFVALWSSVLLLVAGVVLVYHGSGPGQGLVFMTGSLSMLAALALFMGARRRLLTRLTRDCLAENMSEAAARQHARMLFDELMGARKRPERSGAGHVIERLPLV